MFMTKIAFDSFKTILCLNGDLPPSSFFDKFPNLVIVAADGAGEVLIQMGINPTFIVGDFDSFSGDIGNKDIEYIKYTDQNSTDFTKSILEMQKRSLFPAFVCGAFGKEIDHTVNNMHCLMKYGNEFPMVFYDHTISDKPKYCIPIYDKFNFTAIKGEIISLLPYPEAILSTKGLKWNLDNDLLSIGGASSVRNQAQNTNIEIKVHQGQLMLIVTD